jgi:hypothetical protein
MNTNGHESQLIHGGLVYSIEGNAAAALPNKPKLEWERIVL